MSGQETVIMKKYLSLRVYHLVLLMAIFFLAACKKDTSTITTKTYTIYTPVYKSAAQVLANINGSASTAIDHAGKLYLKDEFIYLNEVNKGIHIINNRNPARPQQVAFLAIPGNLDIAIKGNILYADMYDDLLALDISNPSQARITSTLHNFFTGRSYVNGYQSNFDGKIAVDWIGRDTTVLLEQFPGNCAPCATFDLAANSLQSGTGTAGSMAGMVLMNDHLYAITEMHSLGIVDVSVPAQPHADSSFFAGFDLQTVFPFDGKLFLGSAVGMFMYDVSDPAHPFSLGEFSHGRACDPVITDGHYAYVTLHAGDGCGGSANELNVIDINDIRQPSLIKSYPLSKPTGLCLDGNLLFVCDDTRVKIFNAANPASLQLLQSITLTDPYDVIAANNRAMIVTSTGLYQYDYSNLNHIRSLGFMEVKR